MSDEADRKAFEAFEAFEEWCERERVNPAMIPVVRFAWMDSRDHYRKQVAELVEAVAEDEIQVIAYGITDDGDAYTAISNSNLSYIQDLAAKLKEQHNETK